MELVTLDRRGEGECGEASRSGQMLTQTSKPLSLGNGAREPSIVSAPPGMMGLNLLIGGRSVQMTQLVGIDALLRRETPVRALDFKAEVPCPVKNRFQAAYEEFLADQLVVNQRRYYSFVPSMCGEHVDDPGAARDVGAATKADQLPQVAIDSATGSFVSPVAIQRFAKTGAFTSVVDLTSVPFLDADAFTDPLGAYNVIAVNPEVLLVDRKLLGDRPVPSSLTDLLDPIYADSISIGDSHHAVGTRFLTWVALTHKEAGLAAIDRNIVTALNGPTTARTAGHGGAAAIYLAPWVFAQGAVKPGRLEIVWPREGALCNPLLAIVRADLEPANQPLVDFVTSRALGEVFASSHFPSTVPGVRNVLPDGVRVQWSGWDHLLSGRQVELDAELVVRFAKYHHDNSC
jgi:ABC-type Fe3+ transport system substrate-binding protein